MGRFAPLTATSDRTTVIRKLQQLHDSLVRPLVGETPYDLQSLLSSSANNPFPQLKMLANELAEFKQLLTEKRDALALTKIWFLHYFLEELEKSLTTLQDASLVSGLKASDLLAVVKDAEEALFPRISLLESGKALAASILGKHTERATPKPISLETAIQNLDLLLQVG